MKKYPSGAIWTEVQLSGEDFKFLEDLAGVQFDAQARESIEEEVNDYVADRAFDVQGANRYDLQKHLRRVSKRAWELADLLLGQPDRATKKAALSWFWPLDEAEPKEFIDSLQRLTRRWREQADVLSREGRTAPPGNPMRDVLIVKLHATWAGAGGLLKGSYFDAYSEKPDGPFFVFALKILTLASEKDVSEDGLRKTIDRVIPPAGNKSSSPDDLSPCS